MGLCVSTSITEQIASIHLKIDIHSILLSKGLRNDFGCEELMLINYNCGVNYTRTLIWNLVLMHWPKNMLYIISKLLTGKVFHFYPLNFKADKNK